MQNGASVRSLARRNAFWRAREPVVKGEIAQAAGHIDQAIAEKLLGWRTHRSRSSRRTACIPCSTTIYGHREPIRRPKALGDRGLGQSVNIGPWCCRGGRCVPRSCRSRDSDKLLEDAAQPKKAIGQYQEALFFIKNDDIPDSQQANEIREIEAKIEELQAAE